MVTSFDSSKKLDYLGRDDYDDNYDDDFCSSTLPPNHSKHTNLTIEETTEAYGTGEVSIQTSSSSLSDI